MPLHVLLRRQLAILGLASLTFAAVPPEEYDQWSAAKKVQWWIDHLDVGRGGSIMPADFVTDNPDRCMHQECIHPGGQSTRKDVAHRYECRQKGLHPTGMVAWVKAQWLPNVYTGMFKKADYGYVRWGWQYMDKKMYQQGNAAHKRRHGQPLNPLPEGVHWSKADCLKYDCFNASKGDIWDFHNLTRHERPSAPQFLALKFFRDGVPSASIHTGFSNLPSWNHLGRDYTNLLINFGSQPNDTTAGSMSEQGAERGTQWPGFTGLHDMAMYDQEGNLEQSPNFPYQIIFWPKTKDVLPESCIGLYGDIVNTINSKLEVGTVLYDIIVKHSFEAPTVKIGSIILESKVMMSADTDRQVFFYHPRFDRDLMLRPELTQGFHCKEWWKCPVCPVVGDFCSPTKEHLDVWTTLRERGEKYHHMELYTTLGAKPDELHPNWSCGYAAKAGMDEEEEDEATSPWNPDADGVVELGARRLRYGSALLQKTLSIRKIKSNSAQERMRSDDWNHTEPRSQLLHGPGWFCDGNNSDVWPVKPRGHPWTSSCQAKLQPGRPVSEPEYLLEEGCSDIPDCSKFDGTWYSSVYPCRCGSVQCVTGQLCRRHRDECISWGPFSPELKS